MFSSRQKRASNIAHSFRENDWLSGGKHFLEPSLPSEGRKMLLVVCRSLPNSELILRAKNCLLRTFWTTMSYFVALIAPLIL
jgi:hypothetical protein